MSEAFSRALRDLQLVSHESSVKVKVSADVMDHVELKGSKTHSRKIQMQGPNGMLNQARQRLSQLMEAYYDQCETGQVKPPPRGPGRSVWLLRRPPWSESLQVKRAW